MSIYNEIYGLYYFMLEKILKKASDGPVTTTEINQIVSEYGFSESSLYFTTEVISENGYNLLRKSDEGYLSILKSGPGQFLTNIQKGFIKGMLQDKKIILL
jgi:hypothetical protein